MPQSKLGDASCQTAFTLGQRNYSGNSVTYRYQYPMTSAVNRSPQQQFLAIGSDRILQKRIVSIVNRAYPQAEILTRKDYTTVFKTIEQIQSQSAFVELESERNLDSLCIETGLKLVKRLLASHWHPNILVLCDDPNLLICLQAAVKNYRGGFAAVKKSLLLSDLACYVDLVQWGVIHLPQVLTYPEFQVRWLKLLYLRYQRGFKDRAIAAKLGVSDRTIRNYWKQIQETLDIKDDPDRDTKVLIGIESRRIGLIR